MRPDAKGCESRPGRIRTSDQGIMSQRVNPAKNALSQEGAALGAAVVHDNAPIDPDLQSIIERWPDLPDATKAEILAMVQGSDESRST